MSQSDPERPTEPEATQSGGTKDPLTKQTQDAQPDPPSAQPTEPSPAQSYAPWPGQPDSPRPGQTYDPQTGSPLGPQSGPGNIPPYGPPGYPPQYGGYPPQYSGYPPQYGGYPPPGYGPVPGPRPTNGMAIASLVLGIVWVYWVGSILALVFGYVARRQIAEHGESGSGMALAGIILGWIGMGTLALVLTIFVAGLAVGPT